MKNLLPAFLLFWSCLAQAQYSGTGTFDKITSIGDLTDGYYVIAYGTTYAMNNTYVSSTYLDRTAISPSSNTITDPPAAIVWKIETNGGGRTIYSEGTSKYVSYTGSSNNVQVVDNVTTDNQRWTVSYSGGLFLFTNMAVTGRRLKYNTSSPRFVCYASGQQDLTLYKMDSSSPKPEPSNHASDFACGTTTTSSIPLSWTGATGSTVPDGYLIKWSNTSYAAITGPTDGTAESNGSGVQNVSHVSGTNNYTVSGLSSATTYYFKIWSFTNSGSNIDYKLSGEPQTSCATQTAPWEDFETGTKGSYAAGNVTCTAGSWNLSDALLGTSGSDRKNGSQAVRVQNSGTVSMNFDVSTGIGTVNILHALYGSDGNSTWRLEASTNSGSTWTAYTSSTITTSSSSLTNETFTVNLAGTVRFRLVKLSGGGNRINFDDIYVTSYNPGTISTGSVSSPLCAGASGVSVPFTYSPAANFPNGTTTFTAQLSNASGSFASPTNLQSTGSDASGSQSISVTIPSGTASGTAYRIRVVSNNPAVNGADNGTNISISNSNTSIAPTGTQNISTGQNGTTLNVTEGSTPSSRIWKYATVSGGPYSNSTGVSSTSYTPNFALAGTYYVVCESTYPSPCSNTVVSNEVEIVVSNPQPEIELRGNGQNIVNGDNTPSSGDFTDFGNVSWGDNFSRTFSIHNTGTADLNLNPTASLRVQLSGSPAFSVQTQPSSATIAGGSSLTFVIRFDPAGIGAHNATVSIGNDDSDENPFTFSITGSGTPSNLSTVEFYSPFTTPQNIAYQNYQETDLTDLSLSVMEFRIRDGGASNNDADNLGTTLNSITLNLTNHAQLRRIALYWGSTEIAEQAVSGSTVTFSSLTGAGVTAPDNSNRILSVKVSFQSTVTDNSQFSISFSSANVSPLSTGSAFASFSSVSSETSADRNRIEVTADRLAYGQQPSGTVVNAAMLPAVTVRGVDINNNLDLDFNGSISITSTGDLSGEPVNASASSGVASFASLVHTSTGIDLNLTATTTGLAYSNSVVSNDFSIVSFTYKSGDYRPRVDYTDFSWNGDWEEYDGSSWNTASQAPQNIAPASRPNRIIIHRPGITGGGNYSNTYKNIIVIGGGELILDNNVANPSIADFIASGDTLEVQLGGTVTLNGQIRMNSGASLVVRNGASFTVNNSNIGSSHGFWNGTENFEPGSEFVVSAYRNDGAGTSSLINFYNQIDDNSASAKFGNLKIEFAPPNTTWTIVGGDLTLTLCDTIEITNSGSNAIVFFSNNNSPSVTIAGNLTHHSGILGLTANFTGTMTAQTLTVNGNLTSLGGTLKLYHNGGGTANAAKVNLKGNLKIESGVTVTNDASAASCSFNFNGNSTQTVSVAPLMTGWRLFAKNTGVSSGAHLLLRNSSLNLGNNSTCTVENQATLDFGFDGTNGSGSNALNILDGGSSTAFTHESGARLKITNPSGIVSSGASGNVQTDSRSFSNVGKFYYIGKDNQVTGTALPGSAPGSGDKVIVVDLAGPSLTLTPSSAINLANTDTLWINQGIVDESASGYFQDGGSDGNLRMSGGVYRMEATGITLPRLTGQGGAYQITAGTIELDGAGNQALRGARDYFNLTFSNSGTKTLTSSLPANSLDGLVNIFDNAILDVANRTFNGPAGLNMTGNSRMRMSMLAGETLPQLTGTNNPYTLTGGTVELYGTSSGQTHSLRGTYGGGSTVSYHHVELNANAANVGIGAANVVAGAGFGLKGTLTVNSPVCFQLASAYTISDDGVNSTFDLKPGATLKYGGSIAAFGASGNIRTDVRNFPATASYGFVGSTSPQNAGTGLPSSMVNMYLDKDAASNRVLLEQNTTVTDLLKLGTDVDLGKGKLDLNGYDLTLGTTSSNGTVTGGYADSYVITWDGAANGRLIHQVNSLSTTYTYPLGDLSDYTPFELIMQDADLPLNNASIAAAAKAEAHPQLGTCTNYLNRYWSVEETNLSNPEFDVNYTYAAADPVLSPSSLFPAKYNSLGWLTCVENSGAAVVMGSGNINTSTKKLTWTGLTTFSDFTGLGNGSPLPVSWLQFDGKARDGVVHLDWSTASETNNSHFVVERSINLQEIRSIGTVQGSGNSTLVNQYAFSDMNPPAGTVYYRLKQVDFNGASDYSEWLAVNLENSKAATEIRYVHADRASQSLNLVLSKEATVSGVVISDVAGRVCFRSNSEVYSGAFIRIPFKDMPRGIYFVQLYGGENRMLNTSFSW